MGDPKNQYLTSKLPATVVLLPRSYFDHRVDIHFRGSMVSPKTTKNTKFEKRPISLGTAAPNSNSDLSLKQTAGIEM